MRSGSKCRGHIKDIHNKSTSIYADGAVAVIRSVVVFNGVLVFVSDFSAMTFALEGLEIVGAFCG